MRLPQSLPLQYRFLVRQHITPFDDVDFRQPARSGVSMRHDFKQGVPVELGFHYALDYLVELRTLYLQGVRHVLDVFSLFVYTGKHIAVAENLAFQCLDNGTYMSVLLQAGFIQVNEPGAVIENISRAGILTA